MRKIISTCYFAFRKFRMTLFKPSDHLVTYIVLFVNNVNFSSFSCNGVPRVIVARRGKLTIGSNFRSNNREISNPIGRFHRCSFFVANGATLRIGENLGISGSSIVCHDKITIGSNVKIGGNVVIYDTDFHSINPKHRRLGSDDRQNTSSKPVIIKDNVFIGAHSTILKGVTIGENSVIGACSVVTKDIPENQIWGGNPARLIKEITSNSL